MNRPCTCVRSEMPRFTQCAKRFPGLFLCVLNLHVRDETRQDSINDTKKGDPLEHECDLMFFVM